MKLGTTSHPKFRRLMIQLKLKQYEAAGVLELLWSMAAQFTDDGNLSRFDAVDIAANLDWHSDPETLLKTLVDCRWLDSMDGQFIVHDWEDHMPHFITERIKKRGQRAAKKPIPQIVPGQSRDNAGTIANSLALSDLVQSSVVQDSQAYLLSSGDDDSVKSPKTSPQDVVDVWNSSSAKSKVRTLTDDRKKRIRQRLADPHWPWRAAIKKLPIPNSPKFEWQPDIDWLIANDTNAVRLVEGTYDRDGLHSGEASIPNESDRIPKRGTR